MDPAEVRLENLEQLVSFLTAKLKALEQRIDDSEEPDFFSDIVEVDAFEDLT